MPSALCSLLSALCSPLSALRSPLSASFFALPSSLSALSSVSAAGCLPAAYAKASAAKACRLPPLNHLILDTFSKTFNCY
jgi:hypothetical protein